jgi:hypothetical protein
LLLGQLVAQIGGQACEQRFDARSVCGLDGGYLRLIGHDFPPTGNARRRNGGMMELDRARFVCNRPT